MNTTRTCYRFLAAATFAVLALHSPAGMDTRQRPRPADTPLNQSARANISGDYGKLPLAFEPNVGQTDGQVRFLARGGGMTAFFTDTYHLAYTVRLRAILWNMPTRILIPTCSRFLGTLAMPWMMTLTTVRSAVLVIVKTTSSTTKFFQWLKF